MIAQIENAAFVLPPSLTNERGKLRTVGFEIEFGNLDACDAADIVRGVFGGNVREMAPGQVKICNTSLGDFYVKLDTHIGGNPDEDRPLETELYKIVRAAMSSVIPHEIVTPPVPVDRIEELDMLPPILQTAGASGTGESAFYAFALHINPEASSLHEKAIASVMKSFALLSPWLWDEIRPDMTRRLLGFAEPFDRNYVSKLLHTDYWPPIDILIDDYIDANPSRDRDLDLLPLFAFLNEKRVRARLPYEKINQRPTYHYRLPDARVNDPEWSLVLEWNRWVAVEKVAADSEKLLSACHTYHQLGTDRRGWTSIARQLAKQ